MRYVPYLYARVRFELNVRIMDASKYNFIGESTCDIIAQPACETLSARVRSNLISHMRLEWRGCVSLYLHARVSIGDICTCEIRSSKNIKKGPCSQSLGMSWSPRDGF